MKDTKGYPKIKAIRRIQERAHGHTHGQIVMMGDRSYHIDSHGSYHKLSPKEEAAIKHVMDMPVEQLVAEIKRKNAGDMSSM